MCDTDASPWLYQLITIPILLTTVSAAVESKEGTPTGDSGVGVGGSSDISPSSAANSINDAVPSQLSEPEVDTIAVPIKPPRNIPPIQVDDLEEYIMTRRANDSEELRSEYKVGVSLVLHNFNNNSPVLCFLSSILLLALNM